MTCNIVIFPFYLSVGVEYGIIIQMMVSTLQMYIHKLLCYNINEKSKTEVGQFQTGVLPWSVGTTLTRESLLRMNV